MVEIIYFRDENWNIKGISVNFAGCTDYELEVRLRMLIDAIELALEELKAIKMKTSKLYYCEYDIIRSNKNVKASLNVFEHGVKYLEELFPNWVIVKNF